MFKTRILLAEDDENLGMLLREYLKAKGFDAEWYTNGEKAFKNYMTNHFDLCILDIMMPVKDGLTLAKEIRAINSNVPIIFLTAKSMKDDVLEGFKIGADDYITKPFSMEELLYRIEAILRRIDGSENKEVTEFNIGRYIFDSIKQVLVLDGNESKLTTKEADLLKLLCMNKNKVLERNYALKSIWIDDNYFNARSMDVYIAKLRKLLKDDENVKIMNIHGKGFRLIDEDEN